MILEKMADYDSFDYEINKQKNISYNIIIV